VADRYRAFLIGNSVFPADPTNLPELSGPPHDVYAVRAALTDPVHGLFDRTDVTLKIECESGHLVDELDEFFTTATVSDVLLLYYSGHGRVDATNTLFLCAANTRTDRLRSKAVCSTQLNDMMKNSAATRIVIVLDCCHAGAYRGGDLVTPVDGRGRFVLACCGPNDLAADASGPDRPSAFTRILAEGLRGAAPAHGADPYVTVDELYAHVHRRMEKIGQRPQRGPNHEGHIRIARRAPVVAAPPPPPPGPPTPPPPTASWIGRFGRRAAEPWGIGIALTAGAAGSVLVGLLAGSAGGGVLAGTLGAVALHGVQAAVSTVEDSR
jgi:hypothetical protein